MSHRAGVSVILAHLMLWTSYSTHLALSCNPSQMFGFQIYEQKLNPSLEECGSSSTTNDVLENTCKLNSEVAKTIIPNITENRRKRRSDFSEVSGPRFTRNATYSVSSGDNNAISKAASGTGNALARSYASGTGTSQSKTDVLNGGNATAKAKAQENNSSATATSKGGGHALAASESGGSGNASSTSISQGNGSSKAVAIVLEGHAVATGIHDISQNDGNNNALLSPEHDSLNIDFDDPFFNPGSKITTADSFSHLSTTEVNIILSTNQTEVKPIAFQMGRTLNGEFESSEEQTTSEPTQMDTLSSTTEFKIQLSNDELDKSTSTAEVTTEETRPTPTTKVDILSSTTEDSNGTAYSKSHSRKGNALSRSYALGPGSSKAETNVTNGGNATAQAKALEGNSSATATSTGGAGGHALAAAESGGIGNASSTSSSQGNGSSKAVAIVIEGNALATGIHDASTNDTNDNSLYGYAHDSADMGINFDDQFFRPGYKFTTPPTGEKTTPIPVIRDNNVTEFEVPHSTTEDEAKLRAFPMDRTLNGEFEISEEQTTTENQVKQFAFPMGRTLNGEFDNSEEQSSTKPTDFGTQPSKTKLSTKTPPETTTPQTKTTLTLPTNPPSANKNDIESSTTENEVKPMVFQRGRTLNGEFEISGEQTTTENQAKPMAFPMGRTLNGEFEISEEQTTHEPTKIEIPSSTTEFSILPSTTEETTSPFTTERTYATSTTKVEILSSTTEDEVKPMAFQMGRTLDGEFEISEEQTTPKPEEIDIPISTTELNTPPLTTEIIASTSTTEVTTSLSTTEGTTPTSTTKNINPSSSTEGKDQPMVFQRGRTLDGKFEISEEETTPEQTEIQRSNTELNIPSSITEITTLTSATEKITPPSTTEGTIPTPTTNISPSTTEDEVNPMAFQRGRTLDGEFEISEEQTTPESTEIPSPNTELNIQPSTTKIFTSTSTTEGTTPTSTTKILPSTTEDEFKPMVFQRGRTLNGDLEISEEQITSEPKDINIPRSTTQVDIPSSTTEVYIPLSTTEDEVKPMVFQRGRTLNGEFELSEEQTTVQQNESTISQSTTKVDIILSTTEDEVKLMAFQMGRTLNGEFEISEEQTTPESKESTMSPSTTALYIFLSTTEVTKSPSITEVTQSPSIAEVFQSQLTTEITQSSLTTEVTNSPSTPKVHIPSSTTEVDISTSIFPINQTPGGQFETSKEQATTQQTGVHIQPSTEFYILEVETHGNNSNKTTGISNALEKISSTTATSRDDKHVLAESKSSAIPSKSMTQVKETSRSPATAVKGNVAGMLEVRAYEMSHSVSKFSNKISVTINNIMTKFCA